MNEPHPDDPDIMLEYDFSGGVRGKYADLFPVGSKVVTLDPDVAKLFPDADSVNKALRALGHMMEELPPRKARSGKKAAASTPR